MDGSPRGRLCAKASISSLFAAMDSFTKLGCIPFIAFFFYPLTKSHFSDAVGLFLLPSCWFAKKPLHLSDSILTCPPSNAISQLFPLVPFSSHLVQKKKKKKIGRTDGEIKDGKTFMQGCVQKKSSDLRRQEDRRVAD